MVEDHPEAETKPRGDAFPKHCIFFKSLWLEYFF